MPRVVVWSRVVEGGDGVVEDGGGVVEGGGVMVVWRKVLEGRGAGESRAAHTQEVLQNCN